MTIEVKYRTKAELKTKVGQILRYNETSAFGREYPPSGNGTVFVVGPDAISRKYFAKVTLQDHKIVYVK